MDSGGVPAASAYSKLNKPNESEQTGSSSGSYNEQLDNTPSTSAAAAQQPATAVDELTPQYVQRKLYFLLDHLKTLHTQLPEEYQIRISLEMLAELANSLLNETVFDIVKGLMDIQHVTERHLHQLRDQAEAECQAEVNEWKSKISDPGELKHILALTRIKHERKMHETDMKIVDLLDQKARDQQDTLCKAGVPGFYVTDNTKEQLMQMYLLDFILRLSRLKFDPNK